MLARMRDGLSSKQGQSPESKNVQKSERGTAPGKRTLTSRLSGSGGQSVQRKKAATSADTAPVQTLAQWTQDPWLNAAHGFTGAVQAKGDVGDTAGVHEAAARGVQGSGGALPYFDRIQASFGSHDVSGVRAHQGSAAADACADMGAAAYATGDSVAFGGAPDLHTAAHEAAHVVQQRSGVQLAGGVGQAGDRYEQHADQVADLVVRGESAEPVLNQMTGGGRSSDGPVQRQVQRDGEGDANTRQRQQAARDLGNIDRFDDGFYGSAGSVLEAMLPNDGDKGKLQLNVNLNVNPSVAVSFQFVAEAERDGGNYKVRCEVGAGVTARIDLWVAEAFARAMVFGYLEAQGDSGAEAFRFLVYGIYDRVSSVSRRAADYVWGDSFGRTTRRLMDDDDYVESGLGAEASGGFSTGSGGPSGSAGIRASTGTRISDHGNRREAVGLVTGKLAFNFSPWAGEFSVKLSRRGEVESGEISISGERTANLLDFTSAIENGALQELMINWVAGIVGTVQGLIRGTSGVDGSAAQRFGSVLGLVRTHSFGVNVGSTAALQAARSRVQNLASANIGQKLTIAVGFNPSATTLDITLERLSQIEVGRNPRDAVYLLVENLDRIIRIGPVNIA